jgi:hypothetical protein
MQASLTSIEAKGPAAVQTRDAALDAVTRLRNASDVLLAALATAPDRAMAVSVPFLKLCGLTMGGWLMARAADIAARKLAAGGGDREFLDGKLATAYFYATQILPEVLALERIVSGGSEAVVGTDSALI